MNIENAELTTATRRCPIPRYQNLATAKELNAQLVELYRNPRPTEDEQAVRDLLHLRLEEALGGVARPAAGLLPATVKPATLRPEGPKGWALEVERYREHEQRRLKVEDGKFESFVKQFGYEHEPILNNRHEKRAWLRIVEGL